MNNNEIILDKSDSQPPIKLMSFMDGARDYSFIHALPVEEQSAAIAALTPEDRKEMELFGEENALVEMSIAFDPFMNRGADVKRGKVQVGLQTERVVQLQTELAQMRGQDVSK